MGPSPVAGAARGDVVTAAWPTFSLLFFASQPAAFQRDKFDLFRETTRFADDHGFEAVWIPERHFHAFGGIFPNPALAGVVLAETTERLRIRAGSVVMPLHHPIRVAEEWAVVDNLSDGRVDVSFAIGWNPNDFALAPEAYTDRKRRTFDGIEVVRRLWRGESIETANGLGQTTRVQIHPLPRQKDLTVWLTCSGGSERFVEAGEHGFNVLTALLFQGVDDLREKLAAYREARARTGHPGAGRVTLMLHTFIGAGRRVRPRRGPGAVQAVSGELGRPVASGRSAAGGSVAAQARRPARVRLRALLPEDRRSWAPSPPAERWSRP